jgi:hypothetical protein
MNAQLAELTHNYDCPLGGHPADLDPGINGATTAPSELFGEQGPSSVR